MKVAVRLSFRIETFVKTSTQNGVFPEKLVLVLNLCCVSSLLNQAIAGVSVLLQPKAKGKMYRQDNFIQALGCCIHLENSLVLMNLTTKDNRKHEKIFQMLQF